MDTEVQKFVKIHRPAHVRANFNVYGSINMTKNNSDLVWNAIYIDKYNHKNKDFGFSITF